MIDHYEALFDKQYLRWFHLQDAPALVRIDKVLHNVDMTLPGGAKTKKPIIHLTLVKGKIEDMKPLVLNSTNAKTIALIHGIQPSKWLGKEVVLFRSETEMFDKELRKMRKADCIRIRAKKEKTDADDNAKADARTSDGSNTARAASGS